jgi:hypothetical protein
MMAEQTIPIIRPAPRRLTLLDEATLVRTFAFDVGGPLNLHICIFVGCDPSKL